MSYSVVWRPKAETNLAEAWLASKDRLAVTRAAHEIDRQLQHDPQRAGESRIGTVRILIEEPLAALYEVVEDDRRVLVLSVWQS